MRGNRSSRGRGCAWFLALLAFAAVAGITVLLFALLTNIFERKAEERIAFEALSALRLLDLR